MNINATKKFKLLSIIDTYDYTLNEIYQGQLYERMREMIDVSFITLDELLSSKKQNLNQYDCIYCSLKIRNTLKFLHNIKSFLDDQPIIIQDYDPWVNYIDDSPYKRCYKTIYETINVKQFFVSSKFWSDKIKSDNMNSCPIKLGMLQRHVTQTVDFEKRNFDIEFRGSKHKLRIEGMNVLKSAGINVNWGETIKPYKKFLEHLQSVQIWCHNEQPIIVDGLFMSANSLWPKAIEVLSQGCFLLRDNQEEASWYDLHEMPTAFLFDNIDDAKNKYENINLLSVKEKNERSIETTNFIRNKDYFGDIVKQIIECSEK